MTHRLFFSDGLWWYTNNGELHVLLILVIDNQKILNQSGKQVMLFLFLYS